MSLQPVFDFFAHFSWSELVSGLIGGGIVAAVNLGIGHCLAKNRDTKNRAGNEEIQRKAEARNERTLEDQRRDLKQESEQKERLQAVKSYYVAYTDAFRSGEQGQKRLWDLEIATKIFRLEATTLDHHMHEQTDKILQMIKLLDEAFKPASTSEGHRATLIVSHIRPFQEPLFSELLIWGIHGKSRKVGELLDRELDALRSA